METVLRSATREVALGPDRPFVLIGERINPTGRKALARELAEGDYDRVRADAVKQEGAGAQMLDVNAGVPGLDEAAVLSRLVEIVQEEVDLPLAIDSSVATALTAALERCNGKPLINSVTGEEERLETVLPVVAAAGAAVIGLTHDESGISMDPGERLGIARRIVERAGAHGVPAEDVVIDPLAMSVGADPEAARVALETIRLVRAELGCNLTLGASNISFGLPGRTGLNATFLAMAIDAGLTSAIANPMTEQVRNAILATDVLLARDPFARQWIALHRQQSTTP
jgi:5-methyltetrahydrofolate--homocysteine methyltransferase